MKVAEVRSTRSESQRTNGDRALAGTDSIGRSERSMTGAVFGNESVATASVLLGLV